MTTRRRRPTLVPANSLPRKTNVLPTPLDAAVKHYLTGRLPEAKEICREVLETQPDHGGARHLLDVIENQVGEYGVAPERLGRAIEIDPDGAYAHFSLGNAQKHQGSNEAAIASYRRALDIEPRYAAAHYNLAVALDDLGRADEAIACYRRALLIDPKFSRAHNNLGNRLNDLGKLDEAIVCYRRAVELDPAYVDAHFNLGNALQDAGKIEEAIVHFRQALAIDPLLVGAHNNLGLALGKQGRPDDAAACYRRALEINPEFPDALSNLYHQLQYACSWDELDELDSRLDELTNESLDCGDKTAETPFLNVSRSDDLSRNLAVAKSWSRDVSNRVSIPFSFGGKHPRQGKITIGYISCNFQNHPVAHYTREIFDLHDRHRFDVFCYSYGRDNGGPYRAQIVRACDKFVDIGNIGHVEAAHRINDDGVNILVDLTGHMQGNRLEICALRPAPVQAAYLGFAGTSGGDFFDYIIADRTVSPEESARFYSERIAYLPNCFRIGPSEHETLGKQTTRTDFGLPEDAVVFCSLSQAYKIDPAMFGVWMRILKSVPDSVLWLFESNLTSKRNLKREAANRDVDPHRLIFFQSVARDEYLARARLADLVLETRVYNGATTTSDALAVGVPVVALQGRHFASRISSSILIACGVPELVADSLEAYESLAIRLARDLERLLALRAKIERKRRTAPFFDAPRFVRDLEAIYEEMWNDYLASKVPG